MFSRWGESPTFTGSNRQNELSVTRRMHDSPPPAPLIGFPIIVSWPVQWGDQDAFGHVNNTVYFRWFESGRIACFDRIGLGHAIPGTGLGPILAAINCNYRRPL